MITDWDEAYKNGEYIKNSESFLGIWEEKAAAFRAEFPPEQLRYGPDPRQIIDLFQPEAPKGLMVFVHGGYWRSMDRPLWSHLAKGALKNGWAVAIPGYVLCPQASIADITRQIATATDMAARKIDGPIHLAGHSAGGHLVCRMGCNDVALTCANRLKNIVSISGVHDLRPLVNTAMNNELQLSMASAFAESPAFKTPRDGFSFTAWVGADERPEFIRQSRLMANVWVGCGVSCQKVEEEDQNHFSVIAGLELENSLLTTTLLSGA